MGNPARIHIAEDSKALARRAAELLLTTLEESVALRRTGFLALSGGTTPHGMYRLLAEPPYRRSPSWPRTHLFWVDERCVPHTDGESNFGTAFPALKTLKIPPTQIHPMPTKAASHDAAAAYERLLKEWVPLTPEGLPRFDMILLGLGKDGHTASLFPGDAALDEQSRWVLPVRGGSPYLERLTLTFPVLNNAVHVVFLVSGIDKAPTLKQVLTGEQERHLPAQRVQPVRGEVTWLLDREAASQL